MNTLLARGLAALAVVAVTQPALAAPSHVRPYVVAPVERGADARERNLLRAFHYSRTPGELGIASLVARRSDVVDAGTMGQNEPIRIAMLLRYRHENELNTLVYEQGDKHSPFYHHYIDQRQWLAYFAPSVASVGKIVQSMKRGGFRIESVTPNRTMIVATAPKLATERFFSTSIHRVYQRKWGYKYANVTPAVMPAALRSSVFSVSGLHSIVIADYPAMLKHGAHVPDVGPVAEVPPAASRIPAPRPASALAQIRADATPSPTPTPKPFNSTMPTNNPNPDPTIPAALQYYKTPYGYGAVTFSIAYDYPAQHGFAGKGQSAANVISGVFLDSDLTHYLAEWGENRQGTTTRIDVDGAPANDSDSAGESNLDVEAIVGQSPSVNFYEYLTPPLADREIELAYNKIDSDNIVEEASSSFGGCEDYDPTAEYSDDYIALQGNAEGIGFNASTGDTGSNGCYATPAGNLAPGELPGISVPSTALHFAAIGGTDLIVSPTNASYIKENGWNGSEGGVSIYVPLPSWQSAAVTAGTDPQLTGRNTPDVSFNAALDTAFDQYEGGDTPQGGTSESSPLFCSMVIQIDQVQGSRNGWLNPRLYQIQQGQGYGYAMTDILGGTNVGFVATPGYDNVTGIGSLRGFELASEL